VAARKNELSKRGKKIYTKIFSLWNQDGIDYFQRMDVCLMLPLIMVSFKKKYKKKKKNGIREKK
jgi:hypothetical protein